MQQLTIQTIARTMMMAIKTTMIPHVVVMKRTMRMMVKATITTMTMKEMTMGDGIFPKRNMVSIL